MSDKTVRVSITEGAQAKVVACQKLLNINTRQELLEIAIDRLYVNLVDESFKDDENSIVTLLYNLNDKVDILMERV